MTILYPPRTARSSTRNASMVSAASTPSGNKREEWNWPNLGESTSIAAFLPFFPVQNKPSNHQINSSFTKSGPDPYLVQVLFDPYPVQGGQTDWQVTTEEGPGYELSTI